MAVVVTGFGPFRNHKVNISSEAVKELEKLCNNDDFFQKNDLRLITDEVEVSFHCVREKVKLIWNEYKPRLVIHVGVHGDTTDVLVEDTAFNSGYTMPDVLECVCEDDGCCRPGAIDCLHTQLDVQSACSKLKEAGFQAAVSHDPGRYLCGFIYYSSLLIDPKRVVFVHVPPRENGATPQKLASCLFLLIKELLQQIPN